MNQIDSFSLMITQLFKGEFKYVILIVILFLVPQILIRFSIPLGITAFSMGIFSSHYFNDIFSSDEVISTFSLLGIIVLFIHSGLDVDFKEMRNKIRYISYYLALKLCIFFTLTFLASHFLLLDYKIAALFSLALITPSAGIILSSLKSMPLTLEQKDWVKNFALSFEVLSLSILFIVSSPGSIIFMIVSLACILIGIFVLPPLLKFYSSAVAQYAPGSEFTLVILLGLILGLASKEIGAYYFIGAFLVGISAARYKETQDSHFNKDLIHALNMFAAFFVPFYFFKSGSHLDIKSILNLKSLYYGGLFLVISSILRILPLVIFKMIFLKSTVKNGLGISIALLPNLIFGLVLYELIKASGKIDDQILSGIIIYTIVISTVPQIILKLAKP